MNEHLRETLENSEVILITGKRGSGKTALGTLLLENSPKRESYFVGLSSEYWQLLPDTITPLPLDMQGLENLPSEATILIDEAMIWFYSRNSLKGMNKLISILVTEARHKEQLLVFISHSLRKLDVGIAIDADAIIFKEPSLLHSKFERKEILRLVQEAKRAFDKILPSERVKHAYLVSQDYEGMLEAELPSFWTEELSHAVASVIENKSLNTRTPKHISMAEVFTEGEKKLKEQLEEQFPEIEVIKIECVENVKLKANIKPEYQDEYISKSFTIVAPKKLKAISQEIRFKLDDIHTVKSVFDNLIGKDVYLKAEDKKGVVVTAIGDTVFVKADEEFKWCNKEEFEIR